MSRCRISEPLRIRSLAHGRTNLSNINVEARPGDHGVLGNPGPRLSVSCSFLEGRDDINFTVLRKHKTTFNCKVRMKHFFFMRCTATASAASRAVALLLQILVAKNLQLWGCCHPLALLPE